jgi:type 1 glutamine amidotransferase
MTRFFLLGLAAIVLDSVSQLPAADPWLTVEGKAGPGKGKHVVLVSGDEEYRSEEALPQLAKILANNGFNCTVLFAIDPKDGTINPGVTNNIPGTDKLASADLMVIMTRFRALPDEQMKPIADYLAAGKPVVGLRTATHAFKYKKVEGDFAYRQFCSANPEAGPWKGGFGKAVLGETWVNHHGKHGKEGTRGVVAPGQEGNPVLKGIEPGSIFGDSDVYTVNLPLPGDSTPVVMGQVTETLLPDSKPVEGKKNDPMMPVAWTKTYKYGDSSKPGRVFTTTMGAATDLKWEGTRRMIVNGCLWALGMEDKIPEKTNVDLVGDYKPSPFKMNGAKTGVKPEDLK